MKEIYYFFALVLLDTLFISCFFSIKAEHMKKEVIKYSFFIIAFLTCTIALWSFFKRDLSFADSNLLYIVFINFIRTISISISIVFLFSGIGSAKVILVILNIVFHAIWEVIEYFSFSLFFNPDNLIRYESSGTSFYGVLIIELVIILILKTTRSKGRYRPNKVLFLHTFLTVLSFINFTVQAVGLVAISGDRIVLLSEKNKNIFLTTISGILLVSIYLMVEITNSIQRKTHANHLQKQRYYYLEEYYRDIELHQNEIRKMKHDMNNQLLSIKGQLHKKNRQTVKNQIQEFKNQLE